MKILAIIHGCIEGFSSLFLIHNFFIAGHSQSVGKSLL